MGYYSNGYYYRNRREYVGSGVFATFAEAIDVRDRKQAQRERERAREIEHAERQAFQAARQQARRVDLIVSRGLTAAGLHRPGRHAWRKKAMATVIQSPAVEAATIELAELAAFVFCQAVSKQSSTTHDALTAKLEAVRAELAGPIPARPCGLPWRPRRRAGRTGGLSSWPRRVTPLERAPLSIAAVAGRSGGSRKPSRRLNNPPLTRPRGPRYAIQINQMTAPEPCLAIAQ